jgi:putative acetyltransferase
MIEIRPEKPLDADAIRAVNTAAFGQPQEADVIDKLRCNCAELLSLVALINSRVVGHILFSPVTLNAEHKAIEGMGLAPIAVLPAYQKQGIGSALIRSGLAQLKNTRCPFVIVLGHADYYPRFGFEPASGYDIRSEWDVPNDAFMILVFDQSAVEGVSGVARYRPEFAEAM